MDDIGEMPAPRDGKTNVPVPVATASQPPRGRNSSAPGGSKGAGVAKHRHGSAAASGSRGRADAPMKPAVSMLHPTPLHVAALHGSLLLAFSLLGAFAKAQGSKRDKLIKAANEAVGCRWAICIGCRAAGPEDEAVVSGDQSKGASSRATAPGSLDEDDRRDPFNLHAAAQVFLRPVDLVPARAPAVRALLQLCEIHGVESGC